MVGSKSAKQIFAPEQNHFSSNLQYWSDRVRSVAQRKTTIFISATWSGLLTCGELGPGGRLGGLEEGDNAGQLGGGEGQHLQVAPHQQLDIRRLADLVHIQLSEPGETKLPSRENSTPL